MEKAKFSFKRLEEKYITSTAECIVNAYLANNPLRKAIKQDKEEFRKQVLNKLSNKEHWQTSLICHNEEDQVVGFFGG